MLFFLHAGVGLLLFAAAASGSPARPAPERSEPPLSAAHAGFPEPGAFDAADGAGEIGSPAAARAAPAPPATPATEAASRRAAFAPPGRPPRRLAAAGRRRPPATSVPHVAIRRLPWWVRPSPGSRTGGGETPEAGPPSILVRLHDPEHLLSDDALARLRKEAAAAFRRSGAEIRFVDRGGGPPIVPATLYPEIPKTWKVARGALGVAIGDPDGPRSIFLSVGAIDRALGWRGSGRGPRARPKQGPAATRFGRALGRVLAHELVHAIAPDCPHTGSGLMSARLTRWMLTSPEADFDEIARAYLRRGAAAYGGGRTAPDAP